MGYRNGIVLQLGAIAASVDLDGAVIKEESLNTVCRGPVEGNGDTAQHGHAPTGVKNNPTCPTCKNTTYSTFEKAKQVGTTRNPEFAIVKPEEVAATRAEAVGATKDIIQLTVHRTEDVSTQTIQAESVYWLKPHKDTLAPLYGMFVDALRRHPEYTFLGLWTPVARVGLYQVKLFGDTLVMEQRHRTESLKVEQQPVIAPDAAGQGMIDTILSTLVKDFDPAVYADKYKADLEALIASKESESGIVVAGEKRAAAASVPTGTVDLNAMLAAALGG
jgi:non-homologous end joining protein Ku